MLVPNYFKKSNKGLIKKTNEKKYKTRKIKQRYLKKFNIPITYGIVEVQNVVLCVPTVLSWKDCVHTYKNIS